MKQPETAVKLLLCYPCTILGAASALLGLSYARSQVETAITLLLVGACLLCLGLLASFYNSRVLRRVQYLKYNGRMVQGEIVKLHRLPLIDLRRGSLHQRPYRLICRFALGGQTYQCKSLLYWEYPDEWARIINVFVLEKDPAQTYVDLESIRT